MFTESSDLSLLFGGVLHADNIDYLAKTLSRLHQLGKKEINRYGVRAIVRKNHKREAQHGPEE